MKKNFTFSSLSKKKVSFFIIVLFLMGGQLRGQTTATITFESFAAGATTFSAGGINFNSSGRFIVANSSGLGAGNSNNFLYTNPPATGTAAGTITITNASTAFKINSFAGYASTDPLGNTPSSGTITFTGTLSNGTTAMGTANIPVGGGNGVTSNITMTGGLSGQYMTSVAITMSVGMQYLELDDIAFTTQAIVSNQFSINDVSLPEGNIGTKPFTFTITETDNTTTNTVQIKSADGTAKAGSDYVAFPLTTVTFTAGGAKTKTVDVSVIGNFVIEPNKTFFMNLTNASTGSVILRNQGIGTILDDDEVVETFEDETPNAQTFSQSSFNFYSNGSLLISRGVNVGNTSGISTALDTRIGNGGSTGNVGSFGITNVGISFNITKIDVWTSNNDGLNGTTGLVTVTFVGTKANGAGTVSYAAPIATISGNTFQTINFTGTPLANVNLVAITVILGTGINYIALDDFKYGTASVTGTQLSINDVSVLEGTGGGTTTAVFTITRSDNTSAFSVNVASSDLSAIAGSGYTATSTTLNFTNGGSLSQTVNVNIIRNAVIEPNKTFNMTLSGATNGVLYQKPVGLGTILDDDYIVETFENETNGATTFSEKTIAFSASNLLKVVNSSKFGSGSSDFYLSSGNSAASGSVGKITITSAGIAFKLLQLDAWTGTSMTSYASGQVTFTGTLFGGGTVSTTKTITPTSNTGAGWQQNITFIGTPLENVLLTDLEIFLVGSLRDVDIDNFSFVPFTSTPYLEVTDASTNAITNGGTASATNNTDFGTACTNSSVAKTFTIKNTGTVNLTLNGSTIAVLGGTNANQFSVTTQPTATVSANGSTTVTVSYTPTVAATHNATITLTSNDLLNSPYIITIKGTANEVPSLSVQPVSITSGACTGNPVVFNTSGGGSGTLSYQWYLGGTQIVDGAQAGKASNISGSSTNTLTINNPSTIDNAANYNVKVYSTTGCTPATSSNASLTITTPNTPTSTGTGNKIITTTNTVITDASCNIIANIVPSGAAPINSSNGIVTASVIVSGSVGNYNSKAYVQRHYDIVPASGASTATATVTLYFTQAEFTNYNGYVGTTELPIGPTDPNSGIANIRINQYHGTGTTPGNYTGTGVDINPVDNNIVWNATNNRWEVTFDIIGFSGFYLSGRNTLLPLTLLSFVGNSQDGNALLQWSTTNEVNTNYVEVLKSIDGVDFTRIAKLPTIGDGSNGINNYQYKDALGNYRIYYYQLKMVDKDGQFTTSNIILVNNIAITNDYMVKVGPNPFKSKLLVNVNTTANAPLTLELMDMSGKKLITQYKMINRGYNTIEINEYNNLAHGTYLLHLFNNSINQTIKLIKVD